MAQFDLSIVIPSYNESIRLPNTLIDIQKYLSESGLNAEVIVVNDGSTDDMAAKLAVMQETFPQLKVMSYSPNRGKGYATKTGMLAAQGRYVLYMDSDNSIRISEFDHAKKLLDEYDVAIASRNLPESRVTIDKKHRILIHRISNLLIRTVLGINIRDTQCGFKVFHGEHVQQIFSKQTIDRWGFDMEIIMIAKVQGLRINEFPVTWVDDPNSKVHPVKDTLRTFKELLLIRRNLSQRKYN